MNVDVLKNLSQKYCATAFKKSKILVFHGTRHKFTKFDDSKRELGHHFGGTISQALGRDSRVLLCEITLKNPYDVVSDLGQWDDMEMLEEYFSESHTGIH